MVDLPAFQAHKWPAMGLGILAIALAAAALIMALTQAGSGAAPTYTAAQKAEAKAELCDQYTLAARALNIETQPGGDIALARISMINGALILDMSAANPELDPKYREAARALANSCQTTAVIGTNGMATADQCRAAVDDSNSKNQVMQELCGA